VTAAATRGTAAGAARPAHSRYKAGSLWLLPVGRRRVPGLPVSLLTPRRLPVRLLLLPVALLPVALLAISLLVHLLAMAGLLVTLLAVSGLLLVALLAGNLRPVSVRAVCRRTVRWLPVSLLPVSLLAVRLRTGGLLAGALLSVALLSVALLAMARLLVCLLTPRRLPVRLLLPVALLPVATLPVALRALRGPLPIGPGGGRCPLTAGPPLACGPSWRSVGRALLVLACRGLLPGRQVLVGCSLAVPPPRLAVRLVLRGRPLPVGARRPGRRVLLLVAGVPWTW
jgi:hypothetical protein